MRAGQTPKTRPMKMETSSPAMTAQAGMAAGSAGSRKAMILLMPTARTIALS